MIPRVGSHPPRSPSLAVRLGVVLLLAGLCALLMWSALFSPPKPASEKPVPVHVRKGASAKQIARALHDAGLIRRPQAFLFWARMRDGGIRPGVYTFTPPLSARKIYQTMLQGPPLVHVTFPEGWTAKQMASLLEESGVTSSADFLAIVESGRREGYLFPDTYFFAQDLPAGRVVDRMVQRFREMAPKDLSARARALKLSERELVILASLVEREARVAQERPLIAGVFYNRLKKGWLLESCATVQYALGNWKARLLYKDLAVDSPYNTYRRRGLPPGPIANPGAAALDAAAHPAKTDMMFFVAEGGGTHRFSRYYKDHLNAQKQRKNP